MRSLSLRRLSVLLSRPRRLALQRQHEGSVASRMACRVMGVLIITALLFWALIMHVIHSPGRREAPSQIRDDLLPLSNSSNWTALLGPTASPELVEARMNKRLLKLRGACQTQTQPPQKLQELSAREFFIAHRQKLAWCSVFEAGSAAWLANFVKMAEISDEDLRRSNQPLVTLVRTHFPRPSRAQLNDSLAAGYLSFLVARDPIERLVAAYRNNIESFRAHRSYKALGRRIAQHYRHACSSRRADRTASFPEFVTFVLATAQRPDPHWAPVSETCLPCQFNVNTVAHYDTFAEDHDLILRRAKLLGVLRPALEQSRGPPPRSLSNTLLTSYLRQIDREQLEGLFRLYSQDLKLFGFDTARYTAVVRSAPGLLGRAYRALRGALCEVFW